MIRTYLADVTPLYEEEVYESYFQGLPQWRREKARRIRMTSGKAQSVGVWVLLEKVRKLHGLGEDTLYNLSHSGNYVLCIVSDRIEEDLEAGCDVEEMGQLHLNLARRFFTNNEYETIVSLETEKLQTEMFFRFWVLKESFMKATRQGMKLDSRSFEIAFDDKGCPILVHQPQIFSKHYYYKEYVHQGADVKLAVCATTEEIADHLEIIRL